MSKASILKTFCTLALIFAIGLGLRHLSAMAKIGVGYMVKVTCSEVYLAKRDFDSVLKSDFNNIDPLMKFVKLKNESQEQSVSGRLFGLGYNKAIYRDGIGCTIDSANGINKVKRTQSYEFNKRKYAVNIRADVQEVLDVLFKDNALSKPIMTRGAIVVQNGEIIAENYAQGFTRNTLQQSWSMAKGVTQALVGIAIKLNLLDLSDKELLHNWKQPDPRAEITLGHLLHMASGLEFTEDYTDPFSNVDQMLFNQADMGNYAASQNLINKPGTTSIYSSGTTNIVSKILKNTLETKNISYIDFPYKELFAKLGMRSAIFEVDASGSFIGSSYIYATVRDFARFGQLYLQNGLWNNEQILPDNWVAYTREPAPYSDEVYGSHWSVNTNQKNFPGMPEDVIALGGNDGQYIFVIPEKNAVIVRLGVMRHPATFENDLYPLIKAIYDKL